MSIQKNILIITYDWPPRNSIAVYRPYAWAKTWSAMGAIVTVLTAQKCVYDEPLDLNLPEIDNVKVVEIPYRGTTRSGVANKKTIISFAFSFLKRKSNLIRRLLPLNFDIRDAWAKKAESAALKIIREGNIDIVISTYGPRACHFIAKSIKDRNNNVKWVADYRDLWSIRHYEDLSFFAKKKERALELKTIRNADVFLTVSEPLSEALSLFVESDVHTVYNGFDCDLDVALQKISNKVRERKNSGFIKIVYTGMIYPGWRDPTPLFLAIRNLMLRGLIKNNEIQVHFFGKKQVEIDNLITELGAEVYTTVHGHVAREEALRQQAEADLLLLLESGAPEAKGVLTGKIFEYMVSGTPILSLGSSSDSAIAHVIRQTGTGVICGNDVGEIECVLLKIYESNFNGIYDPNPDEVKKFERKKQSEDLFKLIVGSN